MPASRSQRRPASFGAAGEIGDLARDVDLDRHHRELVGDAREIDQRLAELHALLGVAQPSSNAHCATPTARAAVWMRARFEGLHQLLEALALDAAEQCAGRNLEAVEGDLVFLHAAIAEHLDLAARHALGGEGSASVPRGFSARNIDRPL